MSLRITRRSLVAAGGATVAATGAAIATKRSSAFAAPAVISQTGSNIEVTLWHRFGGPTGESIAALAEEFNARQTGVVLNVVQQGTAYDELAQATTLAIQEGNPPDLATFGEAWWFRFYLSNNLLPLDDLIAASSGFAPDDIIPSFYDEGIRQGRQYWLPFARSTPLVYYNGAMLDAAGLSAFPATWSALAEVAPSLVGETGGITTVAHSVPVDAPSLSWQTQAMVWAFGGAYSDPDFTIRVDEPGAVAAGEYLGAGVEDGWLLSTPTLDDDLTNGLTASTIATTGRAATITSAAEANGIEIRTAFLPGESPDVDIWCPTGGAGLSIVAGPDGVEDERAQAAFTAIEFLLSTASTTRFAQDSGYLPVRASAIESPEMQAFFEANPNFRTAVDQLAVSRPQDTARVFIPGGDGIIGDGFNEIIINGTPAQDALDALSEELRAEAELVVEQVITKEGDLATPAATPAARR